MKKFSFLTGLALWMVAALFYPSVGFAPEETSTTSSSGGGSTAEPTKTNDMQALTINVPDPKTGVPLTFISVLNTSAASTTVTVSFMDRGSLSSRPGDASQAPAPQK